MSFLFFYGQAQKDTLRAEIQKIIRSVHGEVGVAIKHLENNDTLTYHGGHAFAMQSVYKFPLALAMFREVEKGNLSLDQKIHVDKKDLRKNTWSPLQKKFPEGNVDLTLRDLISYTVSESDNNACDILFKLLGGPRKAEKFIHDLGIKDIAITTTEEQMQNGWDVQFKNHCTPWAMVQLLELYHNGQIISHKNTEFLRDLMTMTPRGINRIKGLLPPGTQVAHKPGTGDVNTGGLIGAVNDVGIITFPDGKHLIVSVYISKAPESDKTLEFIIASISKAAFDYYLDF